MGPRKPESVTDKQWAQCLMHTWNLHTNYGGYSYWTDAPVRNRFSDRFREFLGGEVNLSTIDSVWDEYQAAAPGAKSYDRYRPTTPEWLRDAEGTHYTLNFWLETLADRKRQLE